MFIYASVVLIQEFRYLLMGQSFLSVFSHYAKITGCSCCVYRTQMHVNLGNNAIF